jgi:hypothetical protein
LCPACRRLNCPVDLLVTRLGGRRLILATCESVSLPPRLLQRLPQAPCSSMTSARRTSNGTLSVGVTDDGTGLDSRGSAGHGLESMRRRAADLGGRVDVAPGTAHGTTITAELPTGPR